MKVIKKINNNAAVCLDDNNCELVAIGTGIGFPAVPYELTDLSKIQCTYYAVDVKYYNLLNQIPEDVLNATTKIVRLFNAKSNTVISSNIVFTLADHINFAMERFKRNIVIDTPLQYDIQHLYSFEYEIGLEAVKIINKDLDAHLPENEASNIAMHFINAEAISSGGDYHGYVDEVIGDITEIVADYFQIRINKEDFNYSRFVTHLQYLLKRMDTGHLMSSDNQRIFEEIKNDYKEAYECALKIKDYLLKELNMELNNEEILYLILHVNRLCARTDDAGIADNDSKD